MLSLYAVTSGIVAAGVGMLNVPVGSKVSVGDACTAPAALGCFVDPYTSPDGTTRVLQHTVSTGDLNLTHASCVAACCRAGFGVGSLAGLRNGTECDCDHGLGPYDIPQVRTSKPRKIPEVVHSLGCWVLFVWLCEYVMFIVGGELEGRRTSVGSLIFSLSMGRNLEISKFS